MGHELQTPRNGVIYAGRFKFGQRVVIEKRDDTFDGRHGAVISDPDSSSTSNLVSIDDVDRFPYDDANLVTEEEYRNRK